MLAQRTTTAVSSGGSGFSGADVDGLDRVAAECRKGAQVCDEVRMVCEAIVAAASFFGPFGAAFIAYLRGVVIPWLKRISEALKLFAQVLSAHSAVQRDASSSATSLPNYVTPSLPAGNTSDYPTLPVGAGTGGFAVSIDTPAGHAEVVYTPASVTSGSNPFPSPQDTGALTPSAPASVTGGNAALGTPIAADTGTSSLTQPVGVPATSSNAAQPAALGSASLPPTGTAQHHTTPVAATGSGLGSVGDTSAPLGPGGYGGSSGGGSGGGAAPSFGGTGGGIGATGAGLGAGSGAGTSTAGASPSIGSSTSTLGGSCSPTPDGGSAAGSALAGGTPVSHDGLYSGLGQATGVGAGAAAIAKSALTQSRGNGADSLIGTILLPSDGGADGAVQAQIFGGELG